MTRAVDPVVPEAMIREIRKRPPSNLAVPLVSLDSKGFPHIAMLSFFEMLDRDGALHFFIRAASGTARNLSLRTRCTLIFADADCLLYLKGSAGLQATIFEQAVFRLELEAVLEDAAGPDEGEAWIRSGIRFARDSQIDRERLDLRERVKSALLDRP